MFSIKPLKYIFWIILAVRAAVAVLLPPGADEAYYYVYALHPSLSYFDHPPMVAWIGGMIPEFVGWVNSFSIRMGPIILFSFAVYLFFLLGKALTGKEKTVFSTAIFMITPLFFLSGTMLLPDAGLLFFWILGLYVFKKILAEPVLKNWSLFGLAAGLGMLSKYTAVFLYVGAFLFILINRKYRKMLLTPGPYLSVLLGMIVFFPVIYWNASNAFTSFAFQSGRVGVAGIKLRYFSQSLGGQMGYLMPFFFFPAVYYAFKSAFGLLKKSYGEDDKSLLIFSFGSVPVLFFMGASLFKRVLPHWPVIGYITLTFSVGELYLRLYKEKRRLFNIYAYTHSALVIFIMAAVILQVRAGILINRELPESGFAAKKDIKDISVELIGWDKLKDYLKYEFDHDENFLFTHKWYVAGQVEYAVRGTYPMLCLNKKKSITGYSIWQQQEKYLGKTGLFITTSRFYRDPSEKYKEYFDRIELTETIPVRRSGKVVKKIFIYRCENFKKPYPVE
jgi:hypothetical protein